MRAGFILIACILLPSYSWAVTQGVIVGQGVASNPDNSPVYVSGQVRKLPASATGQNSAQQSLMTSNLTILGSSPDIDESALLPATGVEVRFWKADQPGVFYRAQTDEQGRYVIGLSDGVWLGEACGSGNGFYPAKWQLSVVDEKLVSMQVLPQKDIQIDNLSPSDLVEQDSVVTLYGRGFGCSGSLVFTYSNTVDRCGIAQPVEYDHESIRITDFVSRSDTQIRFVMPELDSDRDVMKHIATVQYQQGNSVSRGVAIGEKVLPALNEALCLAQQPKADAPDITIITDVNGDPVMTDDVVVSTESTSSNDSQTSDQTTAVRPSDIGQDIVINDAMGKGSFVPNTATKSQWVK